MTLELFGLISLLIFAAIGLGFVVGSIIVLIMNIIPSIRASRQISQLEADKRVEEKLASLEICLPSEEEKETDPEEVVEEVECAPEYVEEPSTVDIPGLSSEEKAKLEEILRV